MDSCREAVLGSGQSRFERWSDTKNVVLSEHHCRVSINTSLPEPNMEDESRSKDPDLRRLVALCNTMDNVAHILTGEYCEDEPADEPADEPEELPEPHDPHWEIPGMDEEEHNQHDPEDEKPHSRVQVQEGKMRPLAAYLIEHVHSPAFGPQDPFIVDDNDDGPVPHVIIRSIEIDGEPEDPDDYPLVCNGGVFGKSGPIDWREEATEFCLGTKGKQECLMNLDSNSICPE